jgi:hypothetical protein
MRVAGFALKGRATKCQRRYRCTGLWSVRFHTHSSR